jgi:hypothetical protein
VGEEEVEGYVHLDVPCKDEGNVKGVCFLCIM